MGMVNNEQTYTLQSNEMNKPFLCDCLPDTNDSEWQRILSGQMGIFLLDSIHSVPPMNGLNAIASSG